VVHSSDNSYIFGHPENNRTGDAELMRFMMRAWIAFVNDLDPNHHGLEGEPEWPKYRSGDATNVVLRRQGRSLEPDTFRKEGIAFINSIGPEMNK
jgi:carboxylesterase type B